MKEEALILVEELNNEVITDLEYYCPFEFKSYGWNNSAIYFMGITLWTDENDEREYIEDTNEQEPLRDYIVRESKVILKDLNKKINNLSTIGKLINSGREWDWMDDIIEDGIDDYVSVPTGSTCIED